MRRFLNLVLALSLILGAAPSFAGLLFLTPLKGLVVSFPPDTHSVSFNGSTSQIDFGSAFNQDLHSTAHSWNIWINPGTVVSSSNGVFGRYDCTNTVGYGLLSDTRLLWYEAASSGHRLNVLTGNVITPGSNTYHMVTITEDGTGTAAGAKIYLDSVAQSTTAPEDALNGSTVSSVDFTIGDFGNGCPYQYHGLEDLFTDYPSYVLTQSDINALYASGNPTNTDPRTLSSHTHLDAFLPLGEGADTTSTVYDLVGTNNGTGANVTLSTNIP